MIQKLSSLSLNSKYTYQPKSIPQPKSVPKPEPAPQPKRAPSVDREDMSGLVDDPNDTLEQKVYKARRYGLSFRQIVERYARYKITESDILEYLNR